MRTLAIMVCLVLATSTAFAESLDMKAKAKWVSEAPVEKIVGSAAGQAKLTMNGDDLNSIRGTITFKVDTMRSGNTTRDEHLRSAKWLDAENHNEITFTVENVKVNGEKNKQVMTEVIGKMSIHGITQPMTANAKIKVIKKEDGRKKMRIKTHFVIELGKYEIKGKKGIVGKKVGEKIDVNATLIGVVQQ